MPFVSTSTHLLNQRVVKESVKHNRFLRIGSAIELSVIKVANAIGNWPQVLSIALRALSVPGIAVFMVTFMIMPLLIQHFSGWLKNNHRLPKNCQS